jgi:hypothetical protein
MNGLQVRRPTNRDSIKGRCKNRLLPDPRRSNRLLEPLSLISSGYLYHIQRVLAIFTVAVSLLSSVYLPHIQWVPTTFAVGTKLLSSRYRPSIQWVPVSYPMGPVLLHSGYLHHIQLVSTSYPLVLKSHYPVGTCLMSSG